MKYLDRRRHKSVADSVLSCALAGASAQKSHQTHLVSFLPTHFAKLAIYTVPVILVDGVAQLIDLQTRRMP